MNDALVPVPESPVSEVTDTPLSRKVAQDVVRGKDLSRRFKRKGFWG
jgi:hypothetical protein